MEVNKPWQILMPLRSSSCDKCQNSGCWAASAICVEGIYYRVIIFSGSTTILLRKSSLSIQCWGSSLLAHTENKSTAPWLESWVMGSTTILLLTSSLLMQCSSLLAHTITQDFSRRREAGDSDLSPPFLESQDCQFDPTFLYYISSLVLLPSLVTLSVLI